LPLLIPTTTTKGDEMSIRNHTHVRRLAVAGVLGAMTIGPAAALAATPTTTAPAPTTPAPTTKAPATKAPAKKAPAKKAPAKTTARRGDPLTRGDIRDHAIKRTAVDRSRDPRAAADPSRDPRAADPTAKADPSKDPHAPAPTGDPREPGTRW
jgi:hypothetical protein